MTSPLFAAVRSAMAGISQTLYGQPCTLHGMMSAGPNAALQPDSGRGSAVARAVRAEWSGRVELGDNGMGRTSGAFRLGVNAPIARATFEAGCLPFAPRMNDELEWHDRPGERWRIAEIMPDGGTTLTVTLNRVTA